MKMKRFYLTLAFAAAPLLISAPASAAHDDEVTFNLTPNPKFLNCVRGAEPGDPKATVTVVRGKLNDTLILRLSNFKPNLAFDLFTVQRSSLRSDGSPDVNFKNFGMAWYQSDVQVNNGGSGEVSIHTILLDQIFGFDPDVSLAPTNTFHVGFWFNDPADAVPCGFPQGMFTPFNGEHHAGPVAFISRPNAKTGLGPLCSDPDSSKPSGCNP